MRERRADLALLKMLGAAPVKVATWLVCEAAWLSLLPTALGQCLGQGFTLALGWFLKLDNSLLIGGVVWPPEWVVVPCLFLLFSLGSALLLAAGAYQVSVLELLQGR